MPQQEITAKKPSRRVQRLRKVYYGYYDNEFGGPHPVIRLGGKYLEAYGFNVGDTIEVQYEVGRIAITRVEQTESS